MAVTRNSKIQVLYASGSVTPASNDLFNGELAYSYGDRSLYIGGNDQTDVTRIGAEILQTASAFDGSESDNKLVTEKAVYDYVETQLGSAAGVTTVDGVTGAVDLRGGDFISITPGTHPDKGITLSVLYDNVTLGLTSTDKLGVKDGGIGTVQLASDAVTNDKILNSTIQNAKLATSYIGVSTNSGVVQNINLGNALNFNNTTNISASKSSSNISFSLNNDVDITGSLTADTAIHTADLYVTNDASIGGTLEVDGNLIVLGNLTTLDVTRVEVEDPIIFLGATSGSPTARDIGFVAKSTGATYSGLIRETDGVFYLFDTAENLSSSNSFDSESATIKELRAHIVAGTFSAS